MSIYIQIHILNASYFVIENYPGMMEAMRVMIKSVPLSFIWISWNSRNNHFRGGKSISRWSETRRTRHIYAWF